MSRACWASLSADDYAESLDAAEAHADRVAAEFTSAAEALLAGTTPTDLDYPVINAVGPLTSMQKLLDDRDAEGWDNWFRLLMLCPVRDSAEVLLNFQRWAMRVMTDDEPTRRQIEAEAMAMVAQADAQAAEDAALRGVA